jgi:hypothetical protein
MSFKAALSGMLGVKVFSLLFTQGATFEFAQGILRE